LNRIPDNPGNVPNPQFFSRVAPGASPLSSANKECLGYLLGTIAATNQFQNLSLPWRQGGKDTGEATNDKPVTIKRVLDQPKEDVQIDLVKDQYTPVHRTITFVRGQQLPFWAALTPKEVPGHNEGTVPNNPIPPFKYLWNSMAVDTTLAAFSLSRDGKVKATVDNHNTIRIWDTALEQLKKQFSADGEVLDLSVAPDGQTVAVGYDNGEARIFNTSTGQAIKTWKADAKRVTAVSFLPDGTKLAISGDDKIIRLWDLKTSTAQEILGA